MSQTEPQSQQQPLLPAEIGEQLRLQREKKGLSIDDAASATRIRANVLEALENQDVAHIPPVYRRGYILSYSRYLGLSDQDIERGLAQFDNEPPAPRSVFSGRPPRRPLERWFTVTGYLVATLLIGTLAWQVTHEAMRLSQGTERTVEQAGTDGNAANTRNRHVNASIAALETLGPRQSGAGEEAWAAFDAPEPQPQAALQPELLPGMHRLTLETSADSWVEIRDANGKQLEMDLLRAGSERNYEGPAPFDVLVGRASAVTLLLDGEAIAVPADPGGDVTRVRVGPEGG